MDKINICFHLSDLSAGGVIHHVKNIAKYINKNRFNVFLATAKINGLYSKEVLPFFKSENIFSYIDDANLLAWDFKELTYHSAPLFHPLYDFLNQNNIHILCDERGGENKFPLNATNLKCKRIEFNIFSGADNIYCPDKVLCISQGVFNSWITKINKNLQERGEVCKLSIDYPHNNMDLRSYYNIKQDIIVFGRSSNKGRGDSLHLESYAKLENDKTMLMFPSVSNQQLDLIKKLKIKNIIILPVINTYEMMSKFYNTLDVCLHDSGESFGCAVAEAMIHGVPVVSRGWSFGIYSQFNAHEELIQDPFFCAQGRTHEEYLESYINIVQYFISQGREYCISEGQKFKNRIIGNCDVNTIIPKLENIYESIL